eukprot:gnl/MRDRNA2_/MRDRNA2_129479_c0_seq1.p1 gnl/MRDRNA2_/MRDRNA2_129479_c0~~gnl/MRDRNA2_/MRDRNA2_129479_c0_seq1.p1  ORF type:complete len:1429 (-),score=235.13 gnl/MRDRNA2_/MRDRNA2_129479_c0_seq1:117-3932(-)
MPNLSQKSPPADQESSSNKSGAAPGRAAGPGQRQTPGSKDKPGQPKAAAGRVVGPASKSGQQKAPVAKVAARGFVSQQSPAEGQVEQRSSPQYDNSEAWAQLGRRTDAAMRHAAGASSSGSKPGPGPGQMSPGQPKSAAGSHLPNETDMSSIQRYEERPNEQGGIQTGQVYPEGRARVNMEPYSAVDHQEGPSPGQARSTMKPYSAVDPQAEPSPGVPSSGGSQGPSPNRMSPGPKSSVEPYSEADDQAGLSPGQARGTMEPYNAVDQQGRASPGVRSNSQEAAKMARGESPGQAQQSATGDVQVPRQTDGAGYLEQSRAWSPQDQHDVSTPQGLLESPLRAPGSPQSSSSRTTPLRAVPGQTHSTSISYAPGVIATDIDVGYAASPGGYTPIQIKAGPRPGKGYHPFNGPTQMLQPQAVPSIHSVTQEQDACECDPPSDQYEHDGQDDSLALLDNTMDPSEITLNLDDSRVTEATILTGQPQGPWDAAIGGPRTADVAIGGRPPSAAPGASAGPSSQPMGQAPAPKVKAANAPGRPTLPRVVRKSASIQHLNLAPGRVAGQVLVPQQTVLQGYIEVPGSPQQYSEAWSPAMQQTEGGPMSHGNSPLQSPSRIRESYSASYPASPQSSRSSPSRMSPGRAGFAGGAYVPAGIGMDADPRYEISQGEHDQQPGPQSGSRPTIRLRNLQNEQVMPSFPRLLSPEPRMVQDYHKLSPTTTSPSASRRVNRSPTTMSTGSLTLGGQVSGGPSPSATQAARSPTSSVSMDFDQLARSYAQLPVAGTSGPSVPTAGRLPSNYQTSTTYVTRMPLSSSPQKGVMETEQLNRGGRVIQPINTRVNRSTSAPSVAPPNIIRYIDGGTVYVDGSYKDGGAVTTGMPTAGAATGLPTAGGPLTTFTATPGPLVHTMPISQTLLVAAARGRQASWSPSHSPEPHFQETPFIRAAEAIAKTKRIMDANKRAVERHRAVVAAISKGANVASDESPDPGETGNAPEDGAARRRSSSGESSPTVRRRKAFQNQRRATAPELSIGGESTSSTSVLGASRALTRRATVIPMLPPPPEESQRPRSARSASPDTSSRRKLQRRATVGLLPDQPLELSDEATSGAGRGLNRRNTVIPMLNPHDPQSSTKLEAVMEVPLSAGRVPKSSEPLRSLATSSESVAPTGQTPPYKRVPSATSLSTRTSTPAQTNQQAMHATGGDSLVGSVQTVLEGSPLKIDLSKKLQYAEDAPGSSISSGTGAWARHQSNQGNSAHWIATGASQAKNWFNNISSGQ